MLGEERTKPQKMGQKANDPFSVAAIPTSTSLRVRPGFWSDQVRCMAELVRGLRISLDRHGGWYSDQRERERRGFIDGGSATPK
jgi:hypothetical protein